MMRLTNHGTISEKFPTPVRKERYDHRRISLFTSAAVTLGDSNSRSVERRCGKNSFMVINNRANPQQDYMLSFDDLPDSLLTASNRKARSVKPPFATCLRQETTEHRRAGLCTAVEQGRYQRQTESWAFKGLLVKGQDRAVLCWTEAASKNRQRRGWQTCLPKRR